MARVTRRELVLTLLQEHAGEWVNGPEICSPAVGGSEGLRRIRELRRNGFSISMRRHPDRRRAVRQYRLDRQTNRSATFTSRVQPVWVQGHYRTRDSEVKGLNWTTFNHSYGPWYRLRGEHMGASTTLTSNGRGVDVVVVPDMDRTRWFWSVRFAAYRPRHPDDKHVPLKEYTVHGSSDSLPTAQEAAISAFQQGRPIDNPQGHGE